MAVREEEKAGLRARRLVMLVVGLGLVLGIGSYFAQTTDLGWIPNSIAVWTVPAFLVGAVVAPPARHAVGPAAATLVIALVGWYAIAQAVLGVYSPSAIVTALIWAAGGVVAGLVFGVAGPGTDSPATGTVRLVTAVVVTAVLAVPLPRRNTALLLAVPLTAIGLAGYLALNWVLRISAGA